MNVGFKTPIRLDAEPAEQGVDLRTYLNFLWRHWMFIGAVSRSRTARGFHLPCSRDADLYGDSAAPAGSTTRQSLQACTPVRARLQYDYTPMENQLTIIKSDPLLQRVVIKERLVLPPPAAADTPQSTSQSPPDEDAKISGSPTHPGCHKSPTRSAKRQVESGQSNAFNISVTWTDPERAAQLANAIADAYIVDQLDARFEAAKRTSAWLSDRLVELRQQLRDSEEAVAKFRKENGLVRTGPNVTLNEQQLSDLNSKLLAARTDAAEKKTRVDFLDDVLAGKKTLDTLPDSFQSQTGSVMAALRAKLADVSQREADLLARYSSIYPAVVNVAAEKRDIERSIAAETQRIAQTVRSEYALAKARESALEQAMREATGQGGLDSDAAIRLRELERTAAVNKSLFEEFLQKAKITDAAVDVPGA